MEAYNNTFSDNSYSLFSHWPMIGQWPIIPSIDPIGRLASNISPSHLLDISFLY